MKILVKIVFLALLGIFATSFSGCEGSNPQPTQERPTWILNPNKDGKTGAVGVAGKTYDQRISTQRKLAIQRALDELALQQGVKVNLSMKKEEHLKNDTSSVSVDSNSSYKTTSSKALSAHIEDVWQDKITSELYIWLVLDK
jgi:hypothetical protein